MKIPFYKYQGTGNDFVMIDNRVTEFVNPQNTDLIKLLCDRKFGIGADGLILLQNLEGYDFEMVYFNSDGKTSSMCGNGGRCIAAFASYLGVVQNDCSFMAIDGEHQAKIEGDYIELKMSDVNEIEIGADYFVLDTGSPHYVIFVEDLDDIDVVDLGKMIRYGDRFKKEGINVNFVEKGSDKLLIGTYERGVEDETLSCGTGVTAAALSFAAKHSETTDNQINIQSKGGDLTVKFRKEKNGKFTNIWLGGKAERVFSGIFLQD
ncbi:MAG: diaminopimelate epimerase [Saprospiraceae bacterium]|jgi:diaminopimelate epimerase